MGTKERGSTEGRKEGKNEERRKMEGTIGRNEGGMERKEPGKAGIMFGCRNPEETQSM